LYALASVALEGLRHREPTEHNRLNGDSRSGQKVAIAEDAYDFEERAGILEFEAGLHRRDAEEAALAGRPALVGAWKLLKFRKSATKHASKRLDPR